MKLLDAQSVLSGNTLTEKEENIKKALKREIMEELGAKIKKKIKTPEYTENEKSAEMELKWLTKQEALEAMKNNIPKEQDYKSIQLRDYLFMKKALK